jgi:hypothetical protein
MIYKKVSSKTIIAKVLTDLDIQQENYREADMIEWIGEALESIGAFPYFNIKVTGKEDEPILIISNYQSRLPRDLYRPVFVQYSTNEKGPYIPVKWNGNPTMYRGESTESTNLTSVTGDDEVIYFAMDMYSLNYVDALTLLNNDPNVKAKINSIIMSEDFARTLTSKEDPQATTIKYTINNDYIKFNVQNGYVRLVYQAIPADEDGYALVPDDTGFKNALYWYIVQKLFYPRWVSGEVRDRVYMDAQSNYNFYAKQAYANAMMPDIGQLESIKNQWNKLFPELFEFDSSFSQLGEKQTIYNK